jgi:hypothetical protein
MHCRNSDLHRSRFAPPRPRSTLSLVRRFSRSALALALALAGCDGPPAAPDASSPPPDGRAVADGSIDGGGPSADGGEGPAPLVGEAFDCRDPGAAGGLPGGRDLTRVDVDLARFPDALCNDGTGAVFFVRRASRAEDRGRWIVQLQGGGTCSDGQSCADRFCSVGTNFGALKMSNREAPERGTRGAGISRPADNPFGSWNQVLIWYCSSDSWSGTARDVELEAAHPRTGEAVRYRVHFLGSRILDAVVETLRAEEGPLTFTDAEGAEVTMPDLDDAETVILAGASAGSGGVRNQLDRFAETLRATNAACAGGSPCALDVRGLMDAVLAPARERLGYEGSALCEERGICSFEAQIRPVWEELFPLRGAVSDASCAAWHRSRDPGSEWICGDLDHVLRHHVTTPYFLRQDQADAVVRPNTVGLGYMVPSRGDVRIDERLFAELVADEMAELASEAWWRDSAHEGGDVAVVPGAVSPRCGNHEALRNDAAMFDATVAADGVQRDTIDHLSRWLAGTPVAAIARDGSTFSCP